MYMLGPVYTAMATLHLNVGSSYNWVLHILIGTLCICHVEADILNIEPQTKLMYNYTNTFIKGSTN